MPEETELWKSVCGYEGYYEVSTLGRVKSLHYGKQRILKQRISTDGYAQYALCLKHKRQERSAARLVATAFILNSHDKPEVNHKDGVKTNNCVSNLEWATDSEQQLHAFATGLQTAKFGTDNPNTILTAAKGERVGTSKLTKAQILDIRERYAAGCVTQWDLAIEFGVIQSTISAIVRHRLWKHI